MEQAGAAREPFRFSTRLSLSELTGLRAATVGELLALVREVPGSCIYHHTHRFLQQHQYLSPEPPNDFSYWVTEVLGDKDLGERLASIDVMQFATIRALRDGIAATIERYIAENPLVKMKLAPGNSEFHFVKSVSFIIPTGLVARDLGEFAEALGRATIESIYYHVFEARLRLERGDNDFSNWIEDSVGDAALARSISRLDPYTYTMEDLRRTIIRLVERRTEVPRAGAR
ncbi:MAG: DUF5752 family protein [bacterium]|nr:DUF5752 family protein [bacterium]